MKSRASRVREQQFNPEGLGRWIRAVPRHRVKPQCLGPTAPQFAHELESLDREGPTVTLRDPTGMKGWDVDAALERVSRTGRLGGTDAGIGATVPADGRLENSRGRPAPGSLRDSHASASFKAQVGFVLLWFAVVITATVAAYFYVSMKPKVYGSSVEVLYSVGAADSVADDRQLATQIALARSRAVLNPVAQEVDNVTVDELEQALQVEAIAKSAVLRFTVADRDAGRARTLVESVARHYVPMATQQNGIRGSLDERVTTIVEDMRRTVDQEIAELESQAAQPRFPQQPQPPLSDNRVPEPRYMQARLAELQDRLDDARLGGLDAARPRILSEAYVLRRPLSPRPVQGVAAGSLVGIFVATGAVAGLWALRSWASGWRKVP